MYHLGREELRRRGKPVSALPHRRHRRLLRGRLTRRHSGVQRNVVDPVSVPNAVTEIAVGVPCAGRVARALGL